MNRPMSQSKPTDVRMYGFAKRVPVDIALEWVDQNVQLVESEICDTVAAAGRVLAEEIVSAVNVPAFPRAMMDGFALQAGDTSGASAYNKLALSIIGESLPGQPWTGTLKTGQAVRIMTGAPVPAGADAVLPVERTESTQDDVSVLDTVPPGLRAA